MKALSLAEPKHWQKIDVPEPPAPGPGEAVVRVHNVGICGTDLSGYLGKMPFFSYPRIPGHELGVEVVAVGAGVTHVKPGDRCAVEPYINCQTCYACRRGKNNCCEKHQTLGVHCDGGLRPLFTVPARKLHISKKLAYEQLALVETLAIGCHAVDRAELKSDESCLIIGAGPIGLSALEFAKLTGARVIVLDVNDGRLEFCRSTMGVAHTLKPGEALERKLKDLTDGHGPDVVIDATGSVQSMSAAFGLICHGGKLVYVGITTEEVKFRHPTFHRPEGTLLCSRNALSPDFSRIIELIEAGRIDTRPWITHRTAFDDLIDVFPSYVKPETGVIKAVVEVGT
ncbi:MAG: zinc-binding alcohol dehydrogenase family protein [Planctomycetaceae bacterium]|nr:zinc-binding alcohol dehydrogenase family protein [Planctomycetaceae bacterium]